MAKAKSRNLQMAILADAKSSQSGAVSKTLQPLPSECLNLYHCVYHCLYPVWTPKRAFPVVVQFLGPRAMDLLQPLLDALLLRSPSVAFYV